MTRYFPEIVEAVKANLPGDVSSMARSSSCSATGSSSRCYSSASTRLPAGSGCFERDACQLHSLRSAGTRRHRLHAPAVRGATRRARGGFGGAKPPIHLTPATREHDLAVQWFSQFEGAGLDGVVAKPLAGTYQPDKRTMFKIKHERTADCVVAGYRVHKSGPDSIGSLLLGLYKEDGSLASVGVIGAFPAARRKELFTELQPLVTTFDHHPWDWAKLQEATTRNPRSSRAAGGTPARISPSSRCDPSWLSRFVTSTWRATGSDTPPSSSAGGLTAIRTPARTSSWRSR